MWTETIILVGCFIGGYIAGKLRFVSDDQDSALITDNQVEEDNYQDADVFEMPDSTEMGRVFKLGNESFGASTEGLWSVSADGSKIVCNTEDGQEKAILVLSKAKSVKPSDDDLNFIVDAHNEVVPTLLDFVEGLCMRDQQTNKEVSTILQTEEAKQYSPQLKMLLENIKKTTNIYSDSLNGESSENGNKNS